MSSEKDQELLEAVWDNRKFRVIQLLRANANPNTRDSNGQSVLSWARTVRVAELLLDNGAEIDLRDDDGVGRTSLHWAVSTEKPHMVAFLIRRGAKLLPTLGRGRTPLQCAVARTQSRMKTVKRLLKLEYDVPELLNDLALGDRSDEEKSRIARLILICHPEGIDEKDARGWTPLTAAASTDSRLMVSELLKMGANVNQVNGQYKTALHRACEQGQLSILETLLNENASIDSLDGLNRTPLMGAVRYGHIRCIEVLLAKGAKANQTDSTGNSLQSFAALSGMVKVWELVRTIKGLRRKTKDASGKTQLHLACRSGKLEMVVELLKAGYDPEGKDSHGRNTLIHAVQGVGYRSVRVEDSVEVVKYLLEEKHVRVGIQDKDNWTALHWAAEAGSRELYAILKNAGCKDDHVIVSKDRDLPRMCDDCLLVGRNAVLRYGL
jgi:serine/threonine-protein phosphatase 6 regulatory ankyrin repeat subunit C